MTGRRSTARPPAPTVCAARRIGVASTPSPSRSARAATRSDLIPAFKATKDWCEEHGLPESQCLKCNPGLKIERPAKTLRRLTCACSATTVLLLILAIGCAGGPADVRRRPRPPPATTAAPAAAPSARSTACSRRSARSATRARPRVPGQGRLVRRAWVSRVVLSDLPPRARRPAGRRASSPTVLPPMGRRSASRRPRRPTRRDPGGDRRAAPGRRLEVTRSASRTTPRSVAEINARSAGRRARDQRRHRQRGSSRRHPGRDRERGVGADRAAPARRASRVESAEATYEREKKLVETGVSSRRNEVSGHTAWTLDARRS
jgi:hypothetical protein